MNIITFIKNKRDEFKQRQVAAQQRNLTEENNRLKLEAQRKAELAKLSEEKLKLQRKIADDNKKIEQARGPSKFKAFANGVAKAQNELKKFKKNKPSGPFQNMEYKGFKL